jgi:hypothetical protein
MITECLTMQYSTDLREKETLLDLKSGGREVRRLRSDPRNLDLGGTEE